MSTSVINRLGCPSKIDIPIKKTRKIKHLKQSLLKTDSEEEYRSPYLRHLEIFTLAKMFPFKHMSPKKVCICAHCVTVYMRIMKCVYMCGRQTLSYGRLHNL